ncbi:hypothetical protein [Leifsonia sp. fls2-241-R2A-40a]|uniref:hypothetical protein n=1 Tax=Leifsonia sp. fls2-241-R2A-40a TaxID=3040290 RepID=UPI00254D0880|nr:hypothetical protein [Leifsonia sp. fls2-241-R2A-40a]
MDGRSELEQLALTLAAPDPDLRVDLTVRLGAGRWQPTQFFTIPALLAAVGRPSAPYVAFLAELDDRMPRLVSVTGDGRHFVIDAGTDPAEQLRRVQRRAVHDNDHGRLIPTSAAAGWESAAPGQAFTRREAAGMVAAILLAHHLDDDPDEFVLL